ncbi:MAG: 4'-phosphopantetheinyl transferase superfamily protein [Sporocytophaga sp.]|nr:4'-phosphopantetheinyl transferase superfamily protein [Sporocytophaga sp.]
MKKIWRSSSKCTSRKINARNPGVKKEKKEWLATRILLEKLCTFSGIQFHDVHKDALGKPFLVPYNAEISLSHSKSMCCAILNKSGKVGIDIELSSEKIIRVKDKFLSETELAEAGDNLDVLSAYWCVKEAVYKMFSDLKLNFKESIRIKPFGFSDKVAHCLCEIKSGDVVVNTIPMKISRIGNYILAFNY